MDMPFCYLSTAISQHILIYVTWFDASFGIVLKCIFALQV